jgi:hypothetical protein
MTVRPASWSRPAEPAAAAVVAAVAVLLFIGAWALLHRGFYTHDSIVDTPVYQRYGQAMEEGKVPYRDFALEYPPGALPAFALPARGGGADDFETFRHRFEGLMAACGTMMLGFLAVALAALGAGLRRLASALGFVALAPLLLGSVVLSRFDLWPAALTAAAIAALVAGRLRLGHVALGAAVAVKLYPAVLAPLAIAYAWRREGRREGLRCAAVLAGTTALVFLPFVILSPGGVWDSLTRQASRPLQIESLGSSLLLAAHHAFGLDITMRSSHGSQNLEGALPDVLAVAQSVLQALVLVAIWDDFARGPAERERLILAAVPDLAPPGRAPRARPKGPGGVGPARAGARADATLVPIPVLGPRPRLRQARILARRGPGPRAARPPRAAADRATEPRRARPHRKSPGLSRRTRPALPRSARRLRPSRT